MQPFPMALCIRMEKIDRILEIILNNCLFFLPPIQ